MPAPTSSPPSPGTLTPNLSPTSNRLSGSLPHQLELEQEAEGGDTRAEIDQATRPTLGELDLDPDSLYSLASVNPPSADSSTAMLEDFEHRLADVNTQLADLYTQRADLYQRVPWKLAEADETGVTFYKKLSPPDEDEARIKLLLSDPNVRNYYEKPLGNEAKQQAQAQAQAGASGASGAGAGGSMALDPQASAKGRGLVVAGVEGAAGSTAANDLLGESDYDDFPTDESTHGSGTGRGWLNSVATNKASKLPPLQLGLNLLGGKTTSLVIGLVCLIFALSQVMALFSTTSTNNTNNGGSSSEQAFAGVGGTGTPGASVISSIQAQSLTATAAAASQQYLPTMTALALQNKALADKLAQATGQAQQAATASASASRTTPATTTTAALSPGSGSGPKTASSSAGPANPCAVVLPTSASSANGSGSSGGGNSNTASAEASLARNGCVAPKSISAADVGWSNSNIVRFLDGAGSDGGSGNSSSPSPSTSPGQPPQQNLIGPVEKGTLFHYGSFPGERGPANTTLIGSYEDVGIAIEKLQVNDQIEITDRRGGVYVFKVLRWSEFDKLSVTASPVSPSASGSATAAVAPSPTPTATPISAGAGVGVDGPQAATVTALAAHGFDPPDYLTNKYDLSLVALPKGNLQVLTLVSLPRGGDTDKAPNSQRRAIRALFLYYVPAKAGAPGTPVPVPVSVSPVVPTPTIPPVVTSPVATPSVMATPGAGAGAGETPTPAK